MLCYFDSTPHCCNDRHACLIPKLLGTSLQTIVGQINVSQLKFKQPTVSFSLKGYVADKLPGGLVDRCCPDGQKIKLLRRICYDADYSTEMFDEESQRWKKIAINKWKKLLDHFKTSWPIRDVNFTISVDGIEEIDTNKEKITLDIAMAITWQDSRISCSRTCGYAKVRN